MDRIKVGIIGCGYWGPNLIRNFSSCPQTEVVAICDANPARLESVGHAFPHLARAESLDRLLELSPDAVAIATIRWPGVVWSPGCMSWSRSPWLRPSRKPGGCSSRRPGPAAC
jgi:hypothetical protein